MIHISPKFVVPGNDISGLVNAVYSDIVNNYFDQWFMCQRIIMSPKNETCDAINAYVMQLIPGDADAFVSSDSVEDSQAAMYPNKFLNSLSPNGMPPHRLIFKRYASITLLRSLDPTQGLCNGTRLIIRSVTKRLLMLRSPQVVMWE